MIIQRTPDTKVAIDVSFNNKEGGRTFYVRFFEKSLEEEFIQCVESLSIRDLDLSMGVKNGTYFVTESHKVSESYTAWDMLMHKYWSLS